MGGGASSGEEATIGAAKARGEDMDDGVDDRVGILLNACQSVAEVREREVKSSWWKNDLQQSKGVVR
jgi:hypothetical protein